MPWLLQRRNKGNRITKQNIFDGKKRESLMYCIRKIFHPDMFQGKNKRKHYFEGWYYKIVDSKAENTLAVMPGISIGEWDAHAFVQVLYNDKQVHYYRYDLEEFEFNEHKFEIMIGDNYFSKTRMRLSLKSADLSIIGDLYFSNIMQMPKSLCRPGAMGPFLYLPFMECYHEIINIQHNIIGHLKVLRERIDFTGGIGYIEKDWGKSMPQSWIWLQSNHFQPDDVSISISIGRASCCGAGFIGFIALFRYKDRIFLFSTYSGAKIRRIFYNNNQLQITIKDCRFRLDLTVRHGKGGGSIQAPINGRMTRAISETMNAVTKLRFSDRKGNILYQGIGTNTGLEIVE